LRAERLAHEAGQGSLAAHGKSGGKPSAKSSSDKSSGTSRP
jgi:hypothetical protein